MITHQDKTFCNYHMICADGKTCHRRLTNDVKLAAQESGLPISQFSDKPLCHIPVREKDDSHTQV